MAAAIPTVSSFYTTLSYSFNETSLSSPATAAAIPRTSFLPKFVVPRSKPSLPMSSFPLRHNLAVFCQLQQLPAIPQEQRWMFEESEINGPDIWNKTWYPKAADHITTKKTWYIVDATDKILGRMASAIAVHIRGKNLAAYTPSVDMGAYVIVINAEKVAVSGKKRTQKLYRRHSGRPGGLKVETFDQLQNRIPERIIEHAVRGMLPKGRAMFGATAGPRRSPKRSTNFVWRGTAAAQDVEISLPHTSLVFSSASGDGIFSEKLRQTEPGKNFVYPP